MQIPGTNWPRTRNKFGVSPGMMAAIKTDGTLWSWGYNKRGQLGQNSSGTNTNRRSSPTQVGSNTNWDRLHLSAGDSVVASKTDGTLWAWGHNSRGSLGQGNTTQYSSPVQVPGTTWSNAVITATRAVMAVKTDGTLWGWGQNTYGSGGNNNTTQTNSPVQTPGTYALLWHGADFSMAAKEP